MQCHLETTSLPLPHSIQRYDRGPFSYRPGEPLGDFEIFFDHAPGQRTPGRLRDRSARPTACASRSASCAAPANSPALTCHNPHDIPRGEAAAAALQRPSAASAMPTIAAWPIIPRRPIASAATCPSAAPGRGPRRHDGPSDPAPSASPAICWRRLPSAPRFDDQPVSRRGGAVLPVAVAANRGERAVPGRGAGDAEEQSRRKDCRGWPPRSPARSRRSPSFTSNWDRRGWAPANRPMPSRPLKRQSDANRIRPWRC